MAMTQANIETAVELYYRKLHLDGRDVSAIFGGVSRATVCKLKEKARAKMKENGQPIWDSFHVETKSAFEAWGLDIADLEHRLMKLQKLGMRERRC